ncbi:protein FAR1-RELATED SEQUENCE 6-like [Cornus florida]|uniref:protein FAR1-RELATED SEQUENCE 6-like n=1 Tax=Cornus florida TaxID=4283 RepID=UPI0028A205CD|nr:protein FAR1-RELATED SEQUENCE 6-like [Cornus florida]XP_059633775.1 protein FAR1-RELATED SEQUENCE 6-like [Cornus florida]XP_059633776.1 protein FAR1-RELATED SEQUENCE 6-like [Cornus florida]XP_059633777.1 protein FAR1-RELATED SEQUENCE 6-like [Cornus florida]
MDDQGCNAEDSPIVSQQHSPIASQPLGDSELKPKYGMEFDSEEKAYDFYNAYGYKAGFSVRREYANKHRTTGQITSRLFVCCKEGYRGKDKRDHRTKNPRAETRTGCGALMHVKLDRNKGKFWVNKFVELHNHPMVKEECAHMLPSQRRIFKPLVIDRIFKNKAVDVNEGTQAIDVNEGAVQDSSGGGSEVDLDPKLVIAQRYRHLCRMYEEICFMAAQDEEMYNLVLDSALKLEKKLEDVRKRKHDALEDRNSSCQ